MAINLDSIPDTNPGGSMPPVGFHRFVIDTAEMRTAKNAVPGAPQYLNLSLQLFDGAGVRTGTLFDRFTESTNENLRYKLKRLLIATGLDLKGSVELKDLAKLLPKRRGVLEVEHRKDKQDPTRVQAQVRLFGSDCYWPESEYESLTGAAISTPAQTAAPADGDVPFDFDPADGNVPAADRY